MLIVEGPDLAGKTTLCKKTLEYLTDHVYAHFSRLPKHFDYYEMYIDRMSRYIVQDRFHMSEIVYARVRNEEPNISHNRYRMLDAQAILHGGFTVVLFASKPEDTLLTRWREGEMYDQDRVLLANRFFSQIAQSGCFHGYRINVDYTIDVSTENIDLDHLLVEYAHFLAEVIAHEPRS